MRCCFSAADELADLPGIAQEAVEVHFEGEDIEIPVPSVPEQGAADERFEGGYWITEGESPETPVAHKAAGFFIAAS
jgi:hypothetical protein